MFARCLHFWAKMLVSWDRQTQSHWLTVVVPHRGGDAERRGELRALELVRPAGPTSPSPTYPPSLPAPPLQPSHGGNTVRGLWIIGNFNPLKAIIQNKTFQIYSSVESSCLSQACAIAVEASSCHDSGHTSSPLVALLLSALIALMLHWLRVIWSIVCVCVCVFPVAFLSCDSDVTISSLSS